MCQQMTLLASGMGLPPTGEGKDGGEASFQDMIEKVNEKVESGKETPEKPVEKQETAEQETAPASPGGSGWAVPGPGSAPSSRACTSRKWRQASCAVQGMKKERRSSRCSRLKLSDN